MTAAVQWARGGGASAPPAGSVGSCLSLARQLSPGGTGAGVERDTDKRQKNEITEAQRLKTESQEMERPEIPEPENRINREGIEVKEKQTRDRLKPETKERENKERQKTKIGNRDVQTETARDADSVELERRLSG